MIKGWKDYCNQHEDLLNVDRDNDHDECNNKDLVIKNYDKEMDEKGKAAAYMHIYIVVLHI